MKTPLGIYVHIPFCDSRCDYCDFATWVDKNHLVDSYISSILNQIRYHAQGQTKYEVISIFFGGGTPNYIDPNFIGRIIGELKSTFEVANETEITIECNPDFLTMEKIIDYHRFGINRLSLGLQSMDQKVLDFIGRRHNVDHVYNAIEMINKSPIQNFSCDLIYGSAVETMQSWESTLEEVIGFRPNHLSAYALGIEPSTPLGLDVKNKIKLSVNEDDLADKYLRAEDILTAAGYEWYEISNWAKPSYESVHNNLYWTMGEVLALGCVAHGFLNGLRYATPRNIDTFISSFANEITPKSFRQIIETNQRDNQQIEIALALRTKNGIMIDKNFLEADLQPYIEENLVYISENKLVLTPKGRLLEHQISIDLFDMMNKS